MINTKVVNPRKRQFHASLLNRKWVAAKMVNKIQGRSEPSPNSSANSVAWTRKHLRPILLPDEIFSALFCYSEPAVGPVPNDRTNLFVFEGFWRVTGKAIWSRTEPFRPRNFWKAGRFGFGTTWYVLNPRSFVICGLLVHPVCPYTVHLPAHPIFVTHLHRHLQRPLRPHMKVILRMGAVCMRICSTPSRVSPFESRSYVKWPSCEDVRRPRMYMCCLSELPQNTAIAKAKAG